MNQPTQNQDILKKPSGTLVTLAKNAAFGAAFVAAFSAIGTKIPGLKRIFTQSAAKEALNGAVIGIGVGAVLGPFRSSANNPEYQLATENRMLQDQVNQLAQEKSFTEQLLKEKFAAENKSHTRQA